MQNLKQLIKEFRELRQHATPGEWVVQQKSLSNFDHPYIFDRTYGAIFDPKASSTKLVNRPNCDFTCYSANSITKLLDAMEVLVEGLEFYADGAGLDLVDEGRNYSSDYVAYENDFRIDTPTHLDKPVGEYARKALQLAEEKVSGA